MVINGVTKLSYSLTINKLSSATISIIISLVILVCGLILIFNPFKGAILLTKVIGISVIIYSILDLIECYTLKKTVKEFTNVTKGKNDTKVIEAVYEEE